MYHKLNALVANIYYGFPSKNIKIIAVTGTDGKTTTATLIYHIIKSAGLKVALISTVAAYIGNEILETGLHVTSPEPWELQRLIKEIVSKDFDYLVLEVTSHGIDQNRVYGIKPKISVLTNITHEHLDYHGTYINYLNTKTKLIKTSEIAILNSSDESYELVKNQLSKLIKVIPYNTKTLTGELYKEVISRFPEKYNRENATAAVLVAKTLNIGEEVIAKSIKNFAGVIGRMQSMSNKKGIKIYIDFAHTPNALKQVLLALSKNKYERSKIICVFGCASERDPNKRPIMAKHSTTIADYTIFTAEDPRHEDIDKIIAEMVEGANIIAVEKNKADLGKNKVASKKHVYIRVPERGEAIFLAINKIAKKGDIVVICGKGHEKSMAYFGVEHPWSDFVAVKKALAGKMLEIKHDAK